jgi:hypothetical protein
MDANIAIGLITILFGLALIIFQKPMRKLGNGFAYIVGESNVGMLRNKDDPAPPMKSYVKKGPSDKGLKILGAIFIFFGIIITFFPQLLG